MIKFISFLAVILCAAIPALCAGLLHLIFVYAILMEVKDNLREIILGAILVIIFAYADHWIQSIYNFLLHPFKKLTEKYHGFTILLIPAHLLAYLAAMFYIYTHFQFQYTSHYVFGIILCLLMMGFHWHYCKKAFEELHRLH